MGLRGPAPTSTKVLKMRGTYRPDRHSGAEARIHILSAVPRAPKEFDEVMRRIWRTTAKNLIADDRLTTNDVGALESYVIVYARALSAEAVVAKEGRTISTPQGTKRHPELVTAERARADMRIYEQRFGMSPLDRARLRLPPVQPKPAADPWDEVASG